MDPARQVEKMLRYEAFAKKWEDKYPELAIAFRKMGNSPDAPRFDFKDVLQRAKELYIDTFSGTGEISDPLDEEDQFIVTMLARFAYSENKLHRAEIETLSKYWLQTEDRLQELYSELYPELQDETNEELDKEDKEKTENKEGDSQADLSEA